MATLNLQIGANDCDGHEDSETTWNEDGYDSDGWRTGSDADDSFDVGLVFTNVTIPKRSVIDSASLSAFAKWQEGDDVDIIVKGIDEDNTAVWSSESRPSQRSHTTASVSTLWDYSEIDDEDWYTLPDDLSSIIQEIIDRPGWSSGNNLGLVLLNNMSIGVGSQRMQFNDYNYSSANAAKLDITYTLPQVKDIIGPGFIPFPRA